MKHRFEEVFPNKNFLFGYRPNGVAAGCAARGHADRPAVIDSADAASGPFDGAGFLSVR
jgi:hypothetical protein